VVEGEAVALDDVTFSYKKGVPVLRDVSFTASRALGSILIRVLAGPGDGYGTLASDRAILPIA
jgi:ABC-type multidrug transport system fused ATPase/permease subunit